jgi:hypothetical protein
MRRRRFLKTLASMTVAGAAVAAGLPVMVQAQDPLEAVLGDVEAMRALGRHYLDLHPEETPAAQAWRTALAEVGRTGMRAHAAHHARLDLEGGEVVMVDGWVLPRSLALTCSALALS